MLTGRPGHLDTFDYIGLHRYSLTFCTNQRQRLFTSVEVVELTLAQILRAAAENQFGILAYCFMPDHLHLLVEGHSDKSDCRRFIARAKQYAGFYYSKAYGATLWQRYGFERVLRSEEASLDVARYILRNPVRAGLSSNVEDYPVVGSVSYTLEQLLDGLCRTE